MEEIDYVKIYRAWSDDMPPSNCDHDSEGAITLDENGVYIINCSKCGLYGMTNEDGARTLVWIK